MILTVILVIFIIILTKEIYDNDTGERISQFIILEIVGVFLCIFIYTIASFMIGILFTPIKDKTVTHSIDKLDTIVESENVSNINKSYTNNPDYERIEVTYYKENHYTGNIIIFDIFKIRNYLDDINNVDINVILYKNNE